MLSEENALNKCYYFFPNLSLALLKDKGFWKFL